LDVWAGNEELPAALAVIGPHGENRAEFQLLAGQSRAYLSPSGRNFWIYVKSTDAGATTGAKRAQIFVLEAREGGKPFDKQLYYGELGNESAAEIPASGAFAWFVSSGLLNRSNLLQGPGSLKVQFEDLRIYSQDGSSAMVKVWDDYTEPS